MSKCPICELHEPDPGMTYCWRCTGPHKKAKLRPPKKGRDRKTIRLPGFQEGELKR